MLLSDQLKSLCVEHDLTTITLSYHRADHGDYFYTNAHWNDAEGRCASGNDATPEIAIAKAIAEADVIRCRGFVSVTPIELAA